MSISFVAEATTRLSIWQRIKRTIGDVILDSSIIQGLCCFSTAEFDNFRVDERRRDEIRQCMKMHGGYGALDGCVENTIREVFNETGYDLADISQLRLINRGKTRTFKEWDSYFLKLNVDPLRLAEVDLLPACFVPKFAASMALHLRTKLGHLQPNEANMLLAEREYLRVARKLHVRDVDIVSHQRHVLNALFGETVLDSIALTRTRLPAWMRWTHDVGRLESNVLAC